MIFTSCFFIQTFCQLAHPIQQAKSMGLQVHSRILDIDNIDVSVSFCVLQTYIHFSFEIVQITKCCIDACFSAGNGKDDGTRSSSHYNIPGSNRHGSQKSVRSGCGRRPGKCNLTFSIDLKVKMQQEVLVDTLVKTIPVFTGI